MGRYPSSEGALPPPLRLRQLEGTLLLTMQARFCYSPPGSSRPRPCPQLHLHPSCPSSSSSEMSHASAFDAKYGALQPAPTPSSQATMLSPQTPKSPKLKPAQKPKQDHCCKVSMDAIIRIPIYSIPTMARKYGVCVGFKQVSPASLPPVMCTSSHPSCMPPTLLRARRARSLHPTQPKPSETAVGRPRHIPPSYTVPTAPLL